MNSANIRKQHGSIHRIREFELEKVSSAQFKVVSLVFPVQLKFFIFFFTTKPKGELIG